MPLYRKLPHRGFNNFNHRTTMAIINIGELAALDAQVSDVTASVLAANGLIRRDESAVKILGHGEINRALNVTAAKFSVTARTKIEKAGGRAIVI